MNRHAPCPPSPVCVSIYTGEARKQRGILLPSSTGRHRERGKRGRETKKTKMEQCPAFNGENIIAVS